MKTLHQDQSEFNVLYVHSEIDDYGLTAQEFRVYAHLARRAGKNGAWPAVDSMARNCRLNRDTVYQCLKRLKELNLVRGSKRPGSTTIYVLTPRSQWKPNSEGVSEKEGYPLVSDTPYRKVRDTQVSESKGYEGNPSEGTPLKDNTVKRSSRGWKTSPSSQKQPFVPSGGSPNGEPAMNDQNIPKDPIHDRSKSSQSPLKRKAYAIAELLQFQHWDNCKVSFVKQTARAYAEKALQDGHDEQSILKTYEIALHYCHGVATDKINRHECHQHEKASPALTVWLARERLGGDPRTIEQRWQEIINKLTAEKQRAIEEEAKIHREITEKSPEISAWFANRSDRSLNTNGSMSAHEINSQMVTA